MKVLVFAPHPDDAELGCGGSLAEHIANGDSVHVVHITSGEAGNATAEVREREAGIASQVMHTSKVDFWHYADGQGDVWLHSLLVEQIVATLLEVNPDLVYVPHEEDNHIDHKETYLAYIEATLHTALHRCYFLDRTLFYEVHTPIVRPTVFKDISKYADIKRGAIRCHASQLHNSFDEAILALNHYRGLLHGPNKLYMEAFQTL